ncbi:MAG: hypothetical protein EZS28_005415 [Streblomastix strix]|uniref:Uncharacterized protein n=1 Tax=Streblomastix strix TaxID=222440 RepID=A0A5J4WXF8_9EUKA|nr:MAG: hypothetical protein EZS28_005415 [Streblomastix strix]
MNCQFYVFALNRSQNSIASAFAKTHGQKQAETSSQIISKQRCKARVPERDVLQLSPQGNDLQLSPQETHASPLSHPMISTQPIVEARSPNDRESTSGHKLQMQKDMKIKNKHSELQSHI